MARMMKPAGWRYESARHSLAARGIPTGRRYNGAIAKASEWFKTTKLAPSGAYDTPFFSWEGQGERLSNVGRYGGAFLKGTGQTIAGAATDVVAVPYATAKNWDWKTMAPKGAYDTPFLSLAGQGERWRAAVGAPIVGIKNTATVGGFFGGPFDKLEMTKSVAKDIRAIPVVGNIGVETFESAASQPAYTAAVVMPATTALGKTINPNMFSRAAAWDAAHAGPGFWKMATHPSTITGPALGNLGARAAVNAPAVVLIGGRNLAPVVGGAQIGTTAVWPTNPFTGYKPGGSVVKVADKYYKGLIEPNIVKPIDEGAGKAMDWVGKNVGEPIGRGAGTVSGWFKGTSMGPSTLKGESYQLEKFKTYDEEYKAAYDAAMAKAANDAGMAAKLTVPATAVSPPKEILVPKETFVPMSREQWLAKMGYSGNTGLRSWGYS